VIQLLTTGGLNSLFCGRNNFLVYTLLMTLAIAISVDTFLGKSGAQ